MDAILVKIFATAFTLSEVLTHPASVGTRLDPATDQDRVVQLLRAGCDHMRRAFDIETINLDDLISTALDDSAAFGANAKAFHGINFADLNTAYHRFCKNEAVDQPGVDLAKVIEFYNNAAADLPDPTALKDRKLLSMSTVARRCRPTFRGSLRARQSAHLGAPVRNSRLFAGGEDRRFFDHHGVDERGIIRAFLGNLGASGRPWRFLHHPTSGEEPARWRGREL
jgi:penicillin-binding protein 1A